MVMREMPGSAVRPTVRDSMLNARRRNTERNTVQDARFVFDKSNEGVMHI
jgi:hypothetical protein